MNRRTTRDILAAAVVVTGRPVREIVSDSRLHSLIAIRAAIAIVARQRGKSMPQIARVLGQRDHTCVFHYLQRYPMRPNVKRLVAAIEGELVATIPWHCRRVVFAEQTHA